MEIKITNAHDIITETFKGVKLKIRRSNTTEYISKLRHLTKQFQSSIDDGSISTEKDIELTCGAIAGTVLVGWDAFKLADGTLVEYSAANAKNLLVNDPDCRQRVLSVSRQAERFEIQDEGQTLEK